MNHGIIQNRRIIYVLIEKRMRHIRKWFGLSRRLPRTLEPRYEHLVRIEHRSPVRLISPSIPERLVLSLVRLLFDLLQERLKLIQTQRFCLCVHIICPSYPFRIPD